MQIKFSNIGIISYTYSDEKELYYLPIFDYIPDNIHSICGFQHFRIDSVGNNIITLFYHDKQDEIITEKIDITTACKENSSVMLCLCKAENNELKLYVYCDYAHNGLFELTKEFVRNAHHKHNN